MVNNLIVSHFTKYHMRSSEAYISKMIKMVSFERNCAAASVGSRYDGLVYQQSS